MKSTEKMKISDAITKVENGFGSIYSKEDVLNLLNNLDLNGGTNDIDNLVVTKAKPNQIKGARY